MPKPKIGDTGLSAGDIDEIIDLIPERLQAGVLDGTLIVKPQSMWYNETKPVVVDDQGRIKAGRYKKAADIATISKLTAYKRKKGYREMQNMYIGAEPGEHEKQIISLKEIIEALWDAANGSPQRVTCKHCGRDEIVAFKKDPNALFKLYENLVGKATETTEINVNQNTLVQLLSDQRPVSELTVIELPPDQAYERKKLLEESFDQSS